MSAIVSLIDDVWWNILNGKHHVSLFLDTREKEAFFISPSTSIKERCQCKVVTRNFDKKWDRNMRKTLLHSHSLFVNYFNKIQVVQFLFNGHIKRLKLLSCAKNSRLLGLKIEIKNFDFNENNLHHCIFPRSIDWICNIFEELGSAAVLWSHWIWIYT